MAWLKVDDRVRTHPKIVEAGPVAAWVWFCGICYCREHLTDGFISDKMLPTLVPGMASMKKPAAALVLAGLWHRQERGYQVHDFLDWNPSRADVEAQRAADRERKGGGSRPDSSRNPSGPTPDSSRTRDAHTGSGFGSPSVLAVVPGSSEESPRETTPIQPVAPARDRGFPLTMSPLRYEKLKQSFRHIGARLRVPHVLHDEFITKLGGDDADTRLVAWYGELDTEAERSKEPIPDVFVWLRPKFVDWASAGAEDAVLAAMMRQAEAEDAAERAAKEARRRG